MSLRRNPLTPSDESESGGKKLNEICAKIPMFSRLKDVFTAAASSVQRETEFEQISGDFDLLELASYGFPGVATCISYDPIQKLLALGTSVGKVVIMGHEGLALRVGIESSQSIKYIHFLSNLPLIAAITKSNLVYIIDIANITINLVFKSLDEITCIEVYPDSKWLMLGTDLGKMVILDLVYGYPSKYEIESIPSKIKIMKLHPSKNDKVLMGADNGKIYLANLKEGKIISEFDLRRTAHLEILPFLTSIAWNPKSDSFAAGYSNGWVAFWDLADSTQPIMIRTASIDIIDIGLEVALPEQRMPISALAWLQHSGIAETTLVISGGEDVGQDPRLTIIKLSDQFSAPISELSTEVAFNTVKNMAVLPCSYPWSSGTLDPSAILLLSAEGTISGFSLDGEALVLPVLLQWLGCDIIHSQLISNCPSDLHNSIMAHERATQASKQVAELVLEGGIYQPRQVDKFFYDFILTSHGDGSVRLWDSSSNVLSPLRHVTITPSSFDVPPTSLPTFLEFSIEAGCIILGYSDAPIRVFRFCHKSQCKGHKLASESPVVPQLLEDDASPDTPDTQDGSSDTPESGSEPNFYVKSIASKGDLGAYLAFEVYGHQGELSAMEAKHDILAISDKSGCFSIVSLKDQIMLFSESDISSLPLVLVDGNAEVSDDLKEHLVKIHIYRCETYVQIIGVSNQSNGYIYLLSSSVNKVVYKGMLFTNLFAAEEVNWISFYSSGEASEPQISVPASAVASTEATPECEDSESSPTVSQNMSQVTSERSQDLELPTEDSYDIERKKTVASRLKTAWKNKANEKAMKRSLSTSSAGCNTAEAKPLPKNHFRPDDHIVICLPRNILIFKPHSKKIIRDLTVKSERGTILKSKPVFSHDKDVVICLKSTGFVDIYQLPGLQVLYRSEAYLSSTFNAEQCSITDDGRLIVNVNKNELRQLCLIKDHLAFSSPLCSKVQLFDSTRKSPENSMIEAPWYSLPFAKSRPEYIQKLFEKGRPENISPIDRTRSNKSINIKTFSSAAYYKPPATTRLSSSNSPRSSLASPNLPSSSISGQSETNGAPPSAMAAVMNKNKDLLREREEKLAGIGDKTAATADAAQDFLQEIRAFNQKQAKKKWYQF